MSTHSQLSGSFSFLSFLGSKLQSTKLRKIILCIIISYISLRILKKLYKRRYDKVKYVTLKQVLKCNKKYDFIVVGAGTSGSCVAGLIARDTRRPNILLIEAGDRDNYHALSSETIPILLRENQQTSKDWKYKTIPQSNGCNKFESKQSSWSRGKICGGTSILNYMLYCRGNAADYDEWENKYQCKGWKWKDLIPIFKSLEKCIFKVAHKEDAAVRGFGGFQTISRKSDEKQYKLSQIFVEAAQNAGFKYNDDCNGISQDGVSYTQYNIDENGRRLTSFRSFVATLFTETNNKYNIDILPNAHVTKILCKEHQTSDKKIAYGVEIGNNKLQNIYINEQRNGEIIICGGAINSPHLLLLSGIGDVNQLKKHDIPIICNVPGVGLNLKDHILQTFRVTFNDKKIRNQPGIIYQPGFIQIFQYFKQYLLNGSGPFSGSGLDCQIFTKSSIAKKNGLKTNDLQLVQALIGDFGDNDKKISQENAKYYNHDINVGDDYILKWKFKNKNMSSDQKIKSVLALIMNVKPKSVGSITLATNNPFHHPLIDPNYLSNNEDFEVFMEGWKILENVYKNEPFKSLGAEIVEYERFKDNKECGEYMINNYLATIYHPVGTCKMGNLNNDKFAVCSERLRVRGFSNLRIADASVAPDIVAGNTQAMCYVVGCKAANMILEDWKESI